jgi:predicted permease
MLHDFRTGIRQLRREPRFTSAVVVVLALAAGANLAVFSVVDAVLLEPLPYGHPERLVRIWEANPSRGIFRSPVSRGNFADWRRQASSFEAIEAFFVEPRDTVVRFDDGAEVVRMGIATSGFMRMLRVPPLIGHDDAGYRLSYRFWKRRFGGAPNAIGRDVWFEGNRQFARPIVGVMPHDFDFPTGSDMWSTMSFGTERSARNVTVLARLKEGVTLAQARSEMTVLAASLAREFPADNAGWEVEIAPFRETLIAGVRPSLMLLYVSVSLLLIIATANVAVLCLVRRIRRRRDVSVRIALGASPWRIVRHGFIECALLATGASTIALAIAAVAIRLLVTTAPPAIPRLLEVSVSPRVLGAAVALALLMTAVMLGLVSARGFSLQDLRGGPAEARRGATPRLSATLAIAEIAACTFLLIAVSAAVRTFIALHNAPLGFQPAGVLMVDVRQPVLKLGEIVKHYPTRRFLATADAITAYAATIPGVTAVGLTSSPPLVRRTGTAHYRAIGFAITGRLTGAPELAGDADQASFGLVDQGFFDAMSMRVVAGRVFASSDRLDARQIDDRDTERGWGAAVVNETFARRVWPGRNAVGQFLQVDLASFRSVEVVGVVNDVISVSGQPPAPTIYLPYAQDPADRFTVLVRSAADPAIVATALSRFFRERFGSDVTSFGARTYAEAVSEALARPRFVSRVMSGFGVVALVLTGVALYTVLSFVVILRQREMAIRISLGADPRRLGHGVYQSGLAISSVGLALGGLLGGGLSRVLGSFVGEWPSVAGPDLVLVALAVVVTGGIASGLPALRAARTDPIRLLKAE